MISKKVPLLPRRGPGSSSKSGNHSSSSQSTSQPNSQSTSQCNSQSTNSESSSSSSGSGSSSLFSFDPAIFKFSPNYEYHFHIENPPDGSENPPAPSPPSPSPPSPSPSPPSPSPPSNSLLNYLFVDTTLCCLVGLGALYAAYSWGRWLFLRGGWRQLRFPIKILHIIPLENPSPFNSPFAFKIYFNCHSAPTQDLTITMAYHPSANVNPTWTKTYCVQHLPSGTSGLILQGLHEVEAVGESGELRLSFEYGDYTPLAYSFPVFRLAVTDTDTEPPRVTTAQRWIRCPPTVFGV